MKMNFNEDTVAIAMAVYNGEAYLRQQLDSILHQDWSNWILFVRDDGSSDSSLSILHEYQKKDPERIVLIEDPALRGGGAMRNFFAILRWIRDYYPQLNYFMFSDQDDIWLENKIEICLRKIKEEEKKASIPFLVHTDLKVADADLNVLAESFFAYSSQDPHLNALPRLLMEDTVTGCTALWNKRLNDQLVLNTQYPVMHDWWLALTASALGRIIYLDTPTILYRQHGKNVDGASDQYRSSAYIVNKLKKKAAVKDKLKRTIQQGQGFLSVYQEKLNSSQIELLQQFSKLDSVNKLEKIHIVIKYGFFKQGMKRVAGELWLI